MRESPLYEFLMSFWNCHRELELRPLCGHMNKTYQNDVRSTQNRSYSYSP